jgi:parallel beta-helix repeat protein
MLLKNVRSKLKIVLIIELIFSFTISAEEITEPYQSIKVEQFQIDAAKTSGSISGNIHFVGGHGQNNYSKIQDAIDNASDSDTIFVYSGIYYENIIVHISLDIIGEKKETTIIDGSKIGDIIRILTNEVTLTGFTLQNGGSSHIHAGIDILSNENFIFNNKISLCGVGIDLSNTEGNIIENNTIIDSRKDGMRLINANCSIILNNSFFKNWGSSIEIAYSNDNNIIGNYFLFGYGISIYDSNNNVIEFNRFEGTWSHGIEIISNNNIIINNDFFHSGIYLKGEFYSNFIEDNIVNNKPLIFLISEENKFIDNAGQIFLIKCKNISIFDQDLSYCSAGIFISYCDNCIIYNCSTIDNDVTGIEINYSSNITIENCYFFDSKFEGVSIESCNNVKIIDNNFSHNGRDGIRQWKSSNLNISNNFFEFNDCGIYIFEILEGISISNNLFVNNEIGILSRYCYDVGYYFVNRFESNLIGISIGGESSQRIYENILYKNNISGISLSGVDNSYIANNSIVSNNISGIIIDSSCTQNKVFSNIIKDHKSGIVIMKSNNNSIYSNIIEKNFNSVFLEEANDNIIKNNNIFFSPFPAGFFNSYNTTWMGNYWNRPRFLKKYIFGVDIYWPGYPPEPPTITFLINFDYNPAVKPYDIPMPEV